MSKLHIKKGDTVYVNSGEDKGKTGRVLKVLVDKNVQSLRVSTWCLKHKTECKEPARWYREKKLLFTFKLENPVDPKTGKATCW